MMNWTPLITLLAADAVEKPQGTIWTTLILFGPPVILLFIMQTMFGRNDNKDKTKQNEFIATLKKNDPVVTIGGIYGTFISVSEDKTEVTIKVDENSRLKMQASAIRQVSAKTEAS